MNSVPKVLVVDDDPALRAAVARRLSGAGFLVEQAGSADAAMATLQSRTNAQINLLCTDIDMPGSTNGLALAAAVARRWPAIKVLVTSGRTPRESELAGGATFVAKSLGVANLVREIAGKLTGQMGRLLNPGPNQLQFSPACGSAARTLYPRSSSGFR